MGAVEFRARAVKPWEAFGQQLYIIADGGGCSRYEGTIEHLSHIAECYVKYICTTLLALSLTSCGSLFLGAAHKIGAHARIRGRELRYTRCLS